MRFSSRLTMVIAFSVAMAYCESAVVVYLRGWLLPDGLLWNLDAFPPYIMWTEIGREAATIVMLVSIGLIAGKSRWDRVGYFLISFGIWDIFYYIWLKLLIDWPPTILAPDVLFLIPKPWFGYVIEPCAVAALMISFGVVIARRVEKGQAFSAPWVSWALVVFGSLCLYTAFTSYVVEKEIPISVLGIWRHVIVWVALLSFVGAFGYALMKSRIATITHR